MSFQDCLAHWVALSLTRSIARALDMPLQNPNLLHHFTSIVIPSLFSEYFPNRLILINLKSISQRNELREKKRTTAKKKKNEKN